MGRRMGNWATDDVCPHCGSISCDIDCYNGRVPPSGENSYYRSGAEVSGSSETGDNKTPESEAENREYESSNGWLILLGEFFLGIVGICLLFYLASWLFYQ